MLTPLRSQVHEHRPYAKSVQGRVGLLAEDAFREWGLREVLLGKEIVGDVRCWGRIRDWRSPDMPHVSAACWEPRGCYPVDTAPQGKELKLICSLGVRTNGHSSEKPSSSFVGRQELVVCVSILDFVGIMLYAHVKYCFSYAYDTRCYTIFSYAALASDSGTSTHSPFSFERLFIVVCLVQSAGNVLLIYGAPRALFAFCQLWIPRWVHLHWGICYVG